MSSEEKDIFDRSIDFLTERPDLIHDAWQDPNSKLKIGGALFLRLDNLLPDVTGPYAENAFGCPTLVRAGNYDTDDEIMQYIESLEDFPTSPCDIRPEHLKEFAKIQRMADAIFDRSCVLAGSESIVLGS